jgi:hypothetical protein
MDNFLGIADVKALIIGLIGGVISYFLSLGIHRYWSNRNVKSLKRRIEQNEAYKAQLDDLAQSDRSLIIMGFEGVFALLLVIILLPIFFLLLGGFGSLVLITMLVCLIPALVAAGLFKSFRDVREYPKSTKRIEERITKLKNKLLGRHNT